MNPSRFDLAICCRIYPGISRSPLFKFSSKLELVRLNLQTLREALGNLKAKLWVLLDKCPPEYARLVRSECQGVEFEIIELGGEGNEATFVRQIDLLSAQTDSELVYFAEDDYLYLPNALEHGVEFMRTHSEVDYVTLYDHADYHTKYVHRIHTAQYQLEGRTWRQVVSTCLTFMARRQSLVEDGDVFRTYQRRNSDLGLWLALTKTRAINPWSWMRSVRDGLFFPASHALAWRHAGRQILFGKRRTLWAPHPGLATHMESSGLSPHIDWKGMFRHRLDEASRVD